MKMKLIKITSVWCPSCLIMRPRYAEIENEYNMETIEYDYDTDTKIVNKYAVGDILPVVIVVKNDIEVTRIIGEKSKKDLIKIFDSLDV